MLNLPFFSALVCLIIASLLNLLIFILVIILTNYDYKNLLPNVVNDYLSDRKDLKESVSENISPRTHSHRRESIFIDKDIRARSNPGYGKRKTVRYKSSLLEWKVLFWLPDSSNLKSIYHYLLIVNRLTYFDIFFLK